MKTKWIASSFLSSQRQREIKGDLGEKIMGMYPLGTNYMNMGFMPYNIGGMTGGLGTPDPLLQMMLLDQQRQSMEIERTLKEEAKAKAAQAGTTPQATPNAQPAQEMPTLGFKEIHDMANAGIAFPTANQAAQKSATTYRQSEAFGKTLIEHKTNLYPEYTDHQLVKRIDALQAERQQLEALNEELKNVTSKNPVKETETIIDKRYKGKKLNKRQLKKHSKTVEKPLRDAKDVKKDIKTAERTYNKDAVSIQKEMVKAQEAKLAAVNKNIALAKKAAIKARKLEIAKSNCGKLSKFWQRTKLLCSKAPKTEEIQALQKEATAINGNIKELKFNGNSAKWFGRAGWAVAIGVEIWDVKKVADKHGWASKQTAKKTTSAAAGLAGACGGAKLGAIAGAKIGFLIGSIFPGAGNAIGAGIGGFLGGLIGGAAGYFIGQKGADMAFDATMGKTEYKA